MTPFVTAGAGFLIAVLWFDLMFDVQVIRHRRSGDDLPEQVLASIATYYARVTTAARPMNFLVATTMVLTITAIVLEIAGDDVRSWVAWTSLALTAAAVGVAGGHTVAAARRFGTRADTAPAQSRLARSILRDHLFCLAAMSSVLVLQLGWAT